MIFLHHAYPDILTFRDMLMFPIILLIIYLIAKKKRKKYRFQTCKKYFFPAFWLRILGCVLSAMMYQYYYDGGDTFGYFESAVSVGDLLWNKPDLFFHIMFSSPDDYSYEAYNYFRENKVGYYTNAARNMMVIKIGAVLTFFTFSSYLSIGTIITFFSFIGCWKLFEVFKDIYPHLEKQIAIATLYIPSVFFWGAAGLMKDTIIMASIGYFVYGVYFGLLKRKSIYKNLFYMGGAFFFIAVIKVYVAIAFIPAVMVWIFLSYQSKIRNKTLRRLATPFFLVTGSIFGLLAFQKISSSFEERFSQDKIIEYALTVQDYHGAVSKRVDGSGYDLGEIDPSPMGLLKTAPKAINVTLFRPYIWEVRKIILLPSVLESLLSLLLTIYIIYNTGFFRIIKIVLSDPTVLFCLTFSLIFAFAVGFSTYNFGALARYKIPALPFYFVALLVLYSHSNKYSKSTKAP